MTTFRGQVFDKDYALKRAAAILARMPAFVAEIEYSIRHTPLESNFKTPPNWVQSGIVRLTNKGGPLYPLRRINKPGPEWTAKDVGYAQGTILSGLLFFKGGSPALERDTKQIPELGEYMKQMATALRDALKETNSSPVSVDPAEKLPEVKTTLDLAHNSEGRVEGSVAFFEKDGTPHEQAYSYRILGHMCTFWPDVEKFTSVRELTEWLAFDADIFCSQKLVERTCKLVGKKFRLRGRPKKKPNSPK